MTQSLTVLCSKFFSFCFLHQLFQLDLSCLKTVKFDLFFHCFKLFGVCVCMASFVHSPTGAWIVTGGTNAGVMKHVGEAVRDYGLTADGRVICIGIAPWGCVQNREELTCFETKVGISRRRLWYIRLQYH